MFDEGWKRRSHGSLTIPSGVWLIKAEFVEALRLEWAVMPWGTSFFWALYASVMHSFKDWLMDIFCPSFGCKTLINNASDLWILSVLTKKVFSALQISSLGHNTSFGCCGRGQKEGKQISWDLRKSKPPLGEKVGSVRRVTILSEYA